MAPTNLLKLDRVQNQAVPFILGTTKDTPTETMRFMLDTHQCKPDRKWSRSNYTALQCRRKSPQSTPRSRERHKGMQTVTGQVLDGSSRGLNAAGMPADRAQANQGVGKVHKPIPASLRDTSATKLGKTLSRMASRQNRVRDQASHSRKQQTARPHSVH